jgi:hypothetical protein
MSRKGSLRTMSSLVGNAAAPRALEPNDPISLREAVLYESQAEDEAAMRRWNEREIELFRERAIRYASNVIKKRTRSHRGRSVATIIESAVKALDQFIAQDIKKK